MSTATNDVMSLNLHYKYAVKVDNLFITKNDEGQWFLSNDEKVAEARWDVRGALAVYEQYIKEKWNPRLGAKPAPSVVKVHRPQRLHHWW